MLLFVLVVLEVGPQLAMLSQLHHDPDGRGAADAHQLDDVLVVKLLHDVRLLEEFVRHADVGVGLAGLHSDVVTLTAAAGFEQPFVDITKLALADDLTQLNPLPVQLVVLGGGGVVALLVHNLSVVLGEAGPSHRPRAVTGARLLITASAVLWRLAVYNKKQF